MTHTRCSLIVLLGVITTCYSFLWNNELENSTRSEDVEQDLVTMSNQTESNSTEVDMEERQKLQLVLREYHLKCLLAAREDNPDHGDCHRSWDSVICWPPSPPSMMVYVPCPDYVPNLNAHGMGFATRWCNGEGKWSDHPNETEDSGKELEHKFYQGWTNYSQCLQNYYTIPEVDPLTEEWLPVVQRLSIIGYSISLVTLIISFGILIAIKKLRCPRNLLHLNLFASFILRASVVLLRRSFGIDSNDIGCIIMVVLWQYFIAANHSWILMEGLYLHNLIFRAMFADSSAIFPYVLLGWGLPSVMVLLWTILRLVLENSHCWLVHNQSWIFWIAIRAPTTLSVFLNLLFFLNIVRVLATKLNSSINNSGDKHRKLIKSTLVLVPLFGIHYCLLWGLSTSKYPPVELAYLLLDQGCTSFQGFFVAILYCLMNGEVKQELKKTYTKYHVGDDNGYLTTYSTVMSNTRSYVSRARLSLQSIHADDSKRESPMHRGGYLKSSHKRPGSTTSHSSKETYELKTLHESPQMDRINLVTEEGHSKCSSIRDEEDLLEQRPLLGKRDSTSRNTSHSESTYSKASNGPSSLERNRGINTINNNKRSTAPKLASIIKLNGRESVDVALAEAAEDGSGILNMSDTNYQASLKCSNNVTEL